MIGRSFVSRDETFRKSFHRFSSSSNNLARNVPAVPMRRSKLERSAGTGLLERWNGKSLSH